MSKLTYGERKDLPKSDFALPAKRAYPIEDKTHARNALARVSESLNRGHISVSEANKVREKAHAMLDKE